MEDADRRRRPRSAGGLASRLAVAIPGVVLAIVVVAIGGPPFALLVAIVAILGLAELYSLTAAVRPLRWAGYLGTLVLLALAWLHEPSEQAILLGLAASLGLAAIGGLILPRRDEVTQRIATTLLGVVYIGLPLGVLLITRDLPHGAAAVANVLVGTWVFDTASYVGGRAFGRVKIAPKTSPGKTVEGFVIGLLIGTASVWIAGLYMDWISHLQSLLLGLIICLAAYLGDLFESMLKRDAGAKDSGRILGGHGGILDRFDALFFAAVASYFATVLLVL